MSPAIRAGGFLETLENPKVVKQLKPLPSVPIDFCDRLEPLLQRKLARNEIDLV